MKQIQTRRGHEEAAGILGVVGSMGYVAGGFARWCASPRDRPAPPQDIDVFLSGPGELGDLGNALRGAGGEMKSENMLVQQWSAPSLSKRTIQVIRPMKTPQRTTWSPTLEGVLEDFDLTVARCGLISADKALVHDDFEQDEDKRVIRWVHIDCPVGAVLRALKYARKGYRLRAREALRLFEDWSHREEAYRGRISELFETKDPSPKEIEELEFLLRVD